MTAFIAVLIVGLGTYFSRAIFILALADRKLPPALIEGLQYVAPAVLAALVVALLVDSEGNVAIGIPELAAFITGAGTAYKTRNHIYTLIVGMATYWLVRALI